MQGYIFVSKDINIKVNLSQITQDEYIVENVEELLENHNKLTRVYSGKEYPTLVNGVFQRAYYRGDADLVNSKWIQYIMKDPSKTYTLKVEKLYNGMIHFNFGDQYSCDMYLDNITFQKNI